MDTLTKEIFERIAKMESFGMTPVKIATATGLSESRISQIRQMPEYRTVLSNSETAEHEKFQTLNDGWDNVEAWSLNNVLMALKNSPDPDFALRAATIANRAQRRGRQNIPIGSTANGVRAVINLNGNYIEKLQADFTVENHRENIRNTQTLVQKDASYMQPSAVEKLLKPAARLANKSQDLLMQQIGDTFAMA